jgi:hypothetical protein
LKKNFLIKTVTFHERASAIKVVLSCTGFAGKPPPPKKNNSNFFVSSEIGNFNIGSPVNQLIKKGLICRCTTQKAADIHFIKFYKFTKIAGKMHQICPDYGGSWASGTNSGKI